MRLELSVMVGRLSARSAVTACAALMAFLLWAVPLAAQTPAVSAPRVQMVTLLPEALAQAEDAGPIPSSQRITLTLTLAPSATQAAALDEYLTDLATPSSPNYRKWLSPAQFAASYGASAEQIGAATAWLQAQGLNVDAVSPAGTRIAASGFAAQIETAFAVSLHQYQREGSLYFANTSQPSLTADVAPLFSSIEGLDDLPTSLMVSGTGGRLRPATQVNGQPSKLGTGQLAALIDANRTPVLAIDATASVGAPSPSRVEAYTALFRQAAAQGITTLVVRSGDAGGFPATLPEVTAIALPGGSAAWPALVTARPVWQDAPGLPADGLRHAPDLTASSLAAFAQAVQNISLETAGRLGNINPELYALAPLPGIFTQPGQDPDQATAGTWEASTGLGLVDPVALVKAYPHATGTSTLQLASSAKSPTHGQGFVLTAVETSATGGAVPTGTVTFTAPRTGFAASTVALNASGTAHSGNLLLPGGTYTILASYSGDGNYAPVVESIAVTVQPEPAVFTIAAPSTVSLGGTMTAAVTLASASGVGTPSASVTLTPSGIAGTQAITQTVTGSGGTAASKFTFAAAAAGSITLQASCTSADAGFTCSTPQTATIAVPQATPSVLLSLKPAAPAAGQTVTLTAAVTGVAGVVATGNVQFFDGSTSLGFGSAPAATYIGNLPAGASHVLTAVYLGDTNYLRATSNVAKPAVGTVSTTTTVTASASSATFGQAITLSIAVAPSTVVNGTQPTGTLTFTGAGSTTSAAVSGGSANVTLSNLAAGTYTIATSYSGDTNYAASTGNTVTLTVTQATASLSTQLSSASFTTGSTSTLTVTVTLPGSAQLPTGSTFIATIAGVTGASYTGTFAVNVGGNTGTGSAIIPAPLAGSYTLQVTCATNTNYTCTPNSLSITSTATVVTPVIGTTPTTTTLTISPAAPTAGQAVTLTATVSASAAAIAANALTGTVNFYDGTTLLGSGTLATVSGLATATATATLAASTTAQSLTAVYQGSTIYAVSTSPAVSVTPAGASATMTLAANVSSTVSGTSVVLTAIVSGAIASGLSPTGTVSFYVAGPSPALIGVATLGTTGSGVATAVFSSSNLPDGSLTIYAAYGGDSNFGTATSNQISVGVADYGVSFAPQTLSLVQGKTASTQLTTTAINSFSGNIVLGCIPPPGEQVTCSFSPAALSGAGTSTLTVVTTAGSYGSALNRRPGGELAFAGGMAFAGLLCWLVPSRRRRIPGMLLVLLALGLTMNLGCSNNDFATSGTASAAGGTPLGTMLLEITSAGTNGVGTVRHDYPFQVTVVGQ